MVKTRKTRRVQKSKKRYTRRRYFGGGGVKEDFLKAITQVKDKDGKPYTDLVKFFLREAPDYPDQNKKSLEYEGKTYYYYMTGYRPIKFIVQRDGEKEVVVDTVPD